MENNIIVNKFTTINSYDSRIKINKVEGSHYQKTRNGYNLFNPNKALSKTTKTQGGATVTKNIDGSFNITGSGQLSSDFGGDYVDYTHEETLKLIKLGLLKCDFGAVTRPNCFVEFFKKVDGKSTRLFVLENNTNSTVSKEITEEILNSEGLFIRLSFYGANGSTIKPGKIQPMLYQEGDGTFEQFGESPSIEYPSEIEVVGNNINFFNKNNITLNYRIGSDGDDFKESNYFVSEYIPAKANNNYVVNYIIETMRRIAWYDSDKTFIGATTTGNTFKLPNNAAFIRLCGPISILDTVQLQIGTKIIPNALYNKGSIILQMYNDNLFEPVFETKDLNGNTVSNRLISKYPIPKENLYYLINKLPENIYYAFCFYDDITYQSVGNLNWSNELNFGKIEDLIQGQQSMLNSNYIRILFKKGTDGTSSITQEDLKNLEIQLSNKIVTSYTPNLNKNIILPIQKEMLEGDYISDKEYHTWGKYVCTGNENWILSGKAFYIDTITDYAIINNIPICNYFPGVPNVTGSQSGEFDKACVAFINTLESKRFYICYPEITSVDDLKAFLQEKHNSGNPVTIYYKLANILELPLKEEQKEIMNQSIYLYNGDTNIFINSTNSPKIYYDTEKIINDFDFYISKEGYLVIPEYNTKYLINFDESSIPSMPEAVEAAVRAAGRDGDIVLNTTYEPISFTIACYTEDNLSIEEKVEHEAKINIFLNSMKNKTKKFAIEKDNKFYEVKYNAALTTINYPAHLKFSIPFKTSESYAKETKEKNIIGNASEISNTINNVGAIFTIKGPATTPIISLNDFSMEYSTSILKGARIEIDSSKSTVTHINSDGVKVNVMKYYNHQFPKIEKGINTLKVLSGVKDETQVSVKWRDLKL